MKAAASLPWLVIALSLSGPIHAEEQGDTTELEGLLDTSVVSAPSKSPESVSLAPATLIVLTADDLKRYGIRTLDEAINFLGRGMLVEKRFQTGEVGSRGVLLTSDFGSHVLLMIDGHVMNEQWAATAYFDRGATIPFELIDHIELVLGPGSVLYGSNAMLGIVHVVTKHAKDFQGVHVFADSVASATAPGFSWRAAAGVGEQFTLGETPGEVVFEAEYFQQDGPTFDFGPQDYGPDLVTGYPRDFDVSPRDRKYPPGVWGGRGNDAYYTRAPAAYLKLRLGQFELGARAAIYERSDPTNSGNFDDPDSKETDRWVQLDLKHTLSASAVVHLSTRLYADLYDYDQDWTSTGADDCLVGQDAGCLWRLRGAASSAGLEPQLTLDWLEDGRFVTLFGLDGRVKGIRSDVNYYDNVTGLSPGATGDYSPTEKALAVYLQQTFWLTPGLGVNAGARLDIDERFGAAMLPRAAVVWMPWRGGTLKGIYSEAFRAPSAFDVYYGDPTTQIPGGPDLRPEGVRSGELSFEQRAGTQTLELSAFYSRWRDLLLGMPAPPESIADAQAKSEIFYDEAFQIQNVSRIESVGAELGYRGSSFAGRLSYGASVSEAFARRSEPGSAPALLAVMPRVFGNARVAYDLGGRLPTLALAARFVPERPLSEYPSDTGSFARAFAEVRAAVSGPIASSGLSYTVTATYVSAKASAYSIGRGPLPSGELELAPNDRFRLGAGLAYSLPL